MSETTDLSTRKETENDFHTNLPSYTVDALLEKIGVSANIQVWKSIDSIIYVQGIARKIKPYGRVVYFELGGGSSKLSIKCPIELSPQEEENIIVEGLVTLKPSKFHAGLAVTIGVK